MAAHPRPLYRIADIVRRHRNEVEAQHVLTLDQRRLLGSIAVCRTPALGGHLHQCEGCGEVHPVYHSCRKRGCPNCQALAQEQWIEARRERILSIRHFHVIFTLPSELRRLARGHPADIYQAFFRCVGAILDELGRTRLTIHAANRAASAKPMAGAKPRGPQARAKANLGWTLVLHTWKRDLGTHPHIHALVTAGGLSLDGSTFRHVRGKYLFPGQVMGELLRGKMLDALRGLWAKGAFPELAPEAFEDLMARLAAHPQWVVHAEPPFRDATHLLGYLGRYVYRIAISDSRLVEVTDTSVVFRTRAEKTAKLHPVEFLHRFLQHVLPHGFHKVRHGGLYASTRAGGRLEQAKALLDAEIQSKAEPAKPPEQPQDVQEAPGARPICPTCGGFMHRLAVRLLPQRGPPGGACA